MENLSNCDHAFQDEEAERGDGRSRQRAGGEQPLLGEVRPNLICFVFSPVASLLGTRAGFDLLHYYSDTKARLEEIDDS